MQLPQQIFVLGTTLLISLANAAAGESMDHSMHHLHEMTVQSSGVIMNENFDVLPRDCDSITHDYQFTIHGGTVYAESTPGMTFGMSHYEIRVEACSRIEITFVNDDEIRHQWMVHGLPKYLYPAGMFHIEAEGGQRKTGTFIVPSEHRNYLIHCDIAQHMEKGMRGQLVVGEGRGNLWSIIGRSDQFYRAAYLPNNFALQSAGAFFVGFLMVMWLAKHY